MIKLLLFCILLVLCWPLALLALILYPILWLLTLPFRILGIAGHRSLRHRQSDLPHPGPRPPLGLVRAILDVHFLYFHPPIA